MKTAPLKTRKDVGTNADTAGWKPAPRRGDERVFIAFDGQQ
jgi:hypothetical protein